MDTWTQWTQEDVENAVQAVGDKAAADKAFRELVLSNPNEAIKQVTGKEVPQGFRLKTIEADLKADMTFVLPPLQTDELSDSELDQVAGGKGDCGSLHECTYDNPTTDVNISYSPSVTV